MRTARCFIVSAAMASLLIAGCGKKDKATKKSADKPPAAQQEPPTPPPKADTTADVVGRHFEAISKRDMDALMAGYADDALLFSPMGTLEGKEQIRKSFTEIFANFAETKPKFQPDKELFEGDVGYVVWSGESATKTYELGTNTFLVRDGKIVADTFAVKTIPKQPPTDEKAKADDKDKAAPPAPEGPVAAVLAHHLESFGKGDLDAILSDYTPDAFILTQNGPVKGTEAIKGLLTAVLEEFTKPGQKFEVVRTDVKRDIGYIVWKAETADNIYEIGTDTFVIENGKIVAQTFAAKATPRAAKGK